MSCDCIIFVYMEKGIPIYFIGFFGGLSNRVGNTVPKLFKNFRFFDNSQLCSCYIEICEIRIFVLLLLLSRCRCSICLFQKFQPRSRSFFRYVFFSFSFPHKSLVSANYDELSPYLLFVWLYLVFLLYTH